MATKFFCYRAKNKRNEKEQTKENCPWILSWCVELSKSEVLFYFANSMFSVNSNFCGFDESFAGALELISI